MAALFSEAGITQGGFYYHYPDGKRAVAEEIIHRQDGRFAELRDTAIADDRLDGLSALILFLRSIVNEIENDVTVRAGLRLVIQASEHFPGTAHMPHPGWYEAIVVALDHAQNDGSVRAEVDTAVAARGLVLLFIGAQASSFVNDGWQGVSHLAETIVDFLLTTVAAPGFTPPDIAEVV